MKTRKRAPKQLSDSDKAFLDNYTGNKALAARCALWEGSHQAISDRAKRLLKRANAQSYLAEAAARRKVAIGKDGAPAMPIASREERQGFWTDVMLNSPLESNRLKASELLGKSEGDFLERVQHETVVTLGIQLPEFMRAALAANTGQDILPQQAIDAINAPMLLPSMPADAPDAGAIPDTPGLRTNATQAITGDNRRPVVHDADFTQLDCPDVDIDEYYPPDTDTDEQDAFTDSQAPPQDIE